MQVSNCSQELTLLAKVVKPAIAEIQITKVINKTVPETARIVKRTIVVDSGDEAMFDNSQSATHGTLWCMSRRVSFSDKKGEETPPPRKKGDRGGGGREREWKEEEEV